MAQCERCFGNGKVPEARSLRLAAEWPSFAICPECHGSGIVSCCDTAGASESVVKDSTEARPLTKEEADEIKRKHFKPRNALYPGSPASW